MNKAQQRQMGRGERLPHNKGRHGCQIGISEKGRQDKGALPERGRGRLHTEHHRLNEETRKGNMWAIARTPYKNTKKQNILHSPKKF